MSKGNLLVLPMKMFELLPRLSHADNSVGDKLLTALVLINCSSGSK